MPPLPSLYGLVVTVAHNVKAKFTENAIAAQTADNHVPKRQPESFAGPQRSISLE
jgi:hypothetical protein